MVKTRVQLETSTARAKRARDKFCFASLRPGRRASTTLYYFTEVQVVLGRIDNISCSHFFCREQAYYKRLDT